MRLVLLAALLCACKATGTFKCMTSDQCRLGDEVGFCEDAGYCTFADTTCESQRRYDETAEYPLTGECLTGYVTGRVAYSYVVNDAEGAPSVVTMVPEMLALSVELDDETKPTVRIDHDGTFSFAAPPGSHYTMVVPAFGILQTSAPHLEIAALSPSRPILGRATKATPIHFMYNAMALGNLWIASTGVYTETITSGSATNFSFDWYTANTHSTETPGLLDREAHDRLYVNQTANIGGYFSIVASATELLTLADGVSAMAMGQLAPTMRDQCVQLRTTAVAEQARMKSAEPSLTNMTSRWWIGAAQARDRTTTGSFTLAQHVDATTVEDANVNVTFSNPFPGTTTLGRSYVAGSYTVPGGGFTLPLSNWSEVYMPFDSVAGSCAATLSIAGTTAIGGELVVGGTRIDANNKEVMTDVAKRVPVAWSQTVSGVANWWWIAIWEASDDGAGGLVFEPIWLIATPDTHALLPKDLFKSGHTYIAQFYAVQGNPNAAQGDFATAAYPMATTGSWSKSFKIK